MHRGSCGKTPLRPVLVVLRKDDAKKQPEDGTEKYGSTTGGGVNPRTSSLV